MNPLQDSLHLHQHLPIVESQHTQPERPQRFVALNVTRLFVRFEMLPAVEFDHESNRGRVEIDDVSTDRSLPVELNALDLLATQPLPERTFGVGQIRPELSGKWLEIAPVVETPKSPLAPLFQRGVRCINWRETFALRDTSPLSQRGPRTECAGGFLGLSHGNRAP
ncbi:MAG: hypothetical protein AMXMBFR72_25120 [Betaproteobacteria bacterium]